MPMSNANVDEDLTSPLSRHDVIWTDENGDYIYD